MTAEDDIPLVGIDLGATNYRVAVAQGDEILARVKRQTPDVHTGQEIAETLIAATEEVHVEADVDQATIGAVGIGSIGPLDTDSGVVIDPPNLSDSIEGIPLAGPFEDAFGVPVRVENDAIAALIAERDAMDDPPGDMAYLTISTGVGAGVAVDGHVLRGWGGNAAEVGHFVLDPESDLACGCGRTGHWEAFAGGNNIPTYARSLTDEFEGQTDLPLDEDDFSAVDLFELAGEDVLADIVIHRLERFNTLGLANLTHAFAPELVSIGGAVALENEALVVDPLRERLPDRITTRVPELRVTPLGEDAVLRGGLSLAKRALRG